MFHFQDLQNPLPLYQFLNLTPTTGSLPPFHDHNMMASNASWPNWVTENELFSFNFNLSISLAVRDVGQTPITFFFFFE